MFTNKSGILDIGISTLTQIIFAERNIYANSYIKNALPQEKQNGMGCALRTGQEHGQRKKPNESERR